MTRADAIRYAFLMAIAGLGESLGQEWAWMRDGTLGLDLNKVSRFELVLDGKPKVVNAREIFEAL